MATFSVASGMALLADEGILPFNAEKQALASASPAEQATLGSEGLAMRETAVALAMEDNEGHGATSFSPAAMQFLVQEMAAAPAPPTERSSPEASLPQSAGYPYSGWASVPEDVPTSPSPASSVPSEASTPINVLA